MAYDKLKELIQKANSSVEKENFKDAILEFTKAFEWLGEEIKKESNAESAKNLTELQDNVFFKIHNIEKKIAQESSEKSPNTIMFSSVIGHDKAKKEIKDNLVSVGKHLDDIYGISKDNGILLYGPPGTGKTTFAQAVANEINAKFVRILAKDILNKYQGESEKKLAEYIDEAKKEPSALILIEEFEILVPGTVKDDSQQNNRDTIAATFKDIIGGFDELPNVFIIASTNYPWKIEAGVARRLVPIYMGLPNREDREDIVKLKLGNAPVQDDIDYLMISEKTDGCSGSDISKIVNRAKRNAKDRDLSFNDGNHSGVSHQDFELAIENTVISVTDKLLAQYQEFQDELKINKKEG